MSSPLRIGIGPQHPRTRGAAWAHAVRKVRPMQAGFERCPGQKHRSSRYFFFLAALGLASAAGSSDVPASASATSNVGSSDVSASATATSAAGSSDFSALAGFAAALLALAGASAFSALAAALLSLADWASFRAWPRMSPNDAPESDEPYCATACFSSAICIALIEKFG